MRGVRDVVFFVVLIIIMVVCAIIAFVLPKKLGGARNVIKRTALVAFVVILGFLLFCIVFEVLFNLYYPILF